MYKTNFNFDLESIKGRSEAILKAAEVFGSESVLMRRGDGLTYIFDNVIEAILFVISNVKEDEDLVETFSKCKMVEINMTKNIFISTNMSNYIITNTESLKFDNTPVKKENDISDNVKAEIMADIGDLRLSNYLNPACKNKIAITNAINKHISHWKKWWLELTPPEKINLCIETNNGDIITIPYTR